MAENIWDERPEFPKWRTPYSTTFNHYNEILEWKKKEDDWLETLRVDYDLQYDRSMRWLHFLMHGEYTPKQVSEWKEKADLWDQYAIYDNDKEAEIPVKDLITAYEKQEAVKKLVEKGPLLNVDTLADCQQAVDDWLGKLMNVLEGED